MTFNQERMWLRCTFKVILAGQVGGDGEDTIYSGKEKMPAAQTVAIRQGLESGG